MASNSETPTDRLTAAANPRNNTIETPHTYDVHAHFISSLASQSACAHRRMLAALLDGLAAPNSPRPPSTFLPVYPARIAPPILCNFYAQYIQYRELKYYLSRV